MSDEEKRKSADKSGEEQKKPNGIPFLQVAAIFFNQGAMALGAMPNPITGELYVSFESVQDSIAILEVLQEKTRGNLEAEEAEGIASMIDELKLAFVQAVRDPKVRELAEKSKRRSAGPAPEPSKILTPDGRPATSGEAPKIILPGMG